jgi:hypothetical protein
MPELGVVASRAPACHPHDDDFIAADVINWLEYTLWRAAGE